MTRYSNIEYVLNLEFEFGLELFLHANKKRTEAELWEVYLADRSNPQVQQKPYSDYLKRINKPVVKDSGKSKEELLKWAEEVKQMDQKK